MDLRKIMNRKGLFGGTFDPIHNGHLTAAEKVKSAFDLRKIVFVPSAIPPHKGAGRVAGAKDRLAMLHLALAGLDGFSVSDCEIRRPGPSFTVDTVKYFLEPAPKKSKIYLIIGNDAFMEMHTWKSFENILTLIPLIVMMRPGFEEIADPTRRRALDLFVRQNLSDGYGFRNEGAYYEHSILKPIHIFQGGLLDISSTAIRTKIQRKENIHTLVPETVERYIIEKGLYQ